MNVASWLERVEEAIRYAGPFPRSGHPETHADLQSIVACGNCPSHVSNGAADQGGAMMPPDSR